MHWSLLGDLNEERLVKPYALQCGQHLLAEVLTKYCRQFETTKVMFGHALVGLKQDHERVTLSVSKSGETPFEMQADWVIGADGGKSMTRKLIGQHLEGFSWDKESFVAMTVYFPFPNYGWGPANFLIGGKYWAVAGRSGPNETAPWRVAYGVEPGLKDEEVAAKSYERLKEILPGPDKYEIAQCSQYNVHQRQVQE